MKRINQRFFAIVTLVAGVSFGAYGYLTTAFHKTPRPAARSAAALLPSNGSRRESYAMYYSAARTSYAAGTNADAPGSTVSPSSITPPAGSAPGGVPEIPVSTGYVDGVYTGRRESAYYGIVQVQAVIRGGNLVDVKILSYPNDNGTSRYINSVALPRLIKESIRAQGSHVNAVSGATFTSEAYHLSLHLALVQAVG